MDMSLACKLGRRLEDALFLEQGFDIGFERALLDWIVKYRSSWRNKRMKEARAIPTPA